MPIDKLSANAFATGAVANSLGYTPANKAGDTFTGNVVFSANATVTGAAAFSNTVAVTGNVTFSNTVTVSNTITFSDSTTIASSPVGLKNILINGDMRVWQKGTDLNPATTGNAVTTVDRWTTQYVDFSPRIRKVEDTISGETVDTAEITKLSGTYASCELSQKVETTTAKYLRGQVVTFSFWIKKVGSTFGSHNFDAWIGDSETADDTGWTNQRTADRSRATKIAVSPTTFTDTNWQKVTITRTLSSDTNTIYCSIYTQNTPTNEGVRIAKCQLELGRYATPFERRPYGMELLMCQRYYCSLNNSLIGRTESAGVATMVSQYPAQMRSAPTAAYNGLVLRVPGIADYTVNAILTNSSTLNGILISFDAASDFHNPQTIMGSPTTPFPYGLLLNAEF